MIPPEDLDIRPWPDHRGGQHAGVTYGIKVQHMPTGTIAIVQADRSQHRNKNVAVRMIEAALTDPEFRG